MSTIWDSLGALSPPAVGSPAANDVPIWDGDEWVPGKLRDASLHAVAEITGDKFTPGTLLFTSAAVAVDANNFFIEDVRQPKVTRRDVDSGPPTSPAPVDGDIWIAEDVDGENSGNAWTFSYNADSSSGFKWEFIGGAEIYSAVETSQSTSSLTYAALATAGPSVPLPFAGDYDVSVEFGTNVNDRFAYMSYDIGGTGAVDGDATWVGGMAATVTVQGHFFGSKRKTGLSAVTLTAKYRTTAAVATFFSERRMRVKPVRV